MTSDSFRPAKERSLLGNTTRRCPCSQTGSSSPAQPVWRGPDKRLHSGLEWPLNRDPGRPVRWKGLWELHRHCRLCSVRSLADCCAWQEGDRMQPHRGGPQKSCFHAEKAEAGRGLHSWGVFLFSIKTPQLMIKAITLNNWFPYINTEKGGERKKETPPEGYEWWEI